MRRRPSPSRSFERATGRDGFLLVEALAALALGALILVALLSLTGLMRRSADRAAYAVEVSEVSNRTVDTIARELRRTARRRWAVPPSAAAQSAGSGGSRPAAQPGSIASRLSPGERAPARTEADAEDGADQGPPRPFVFSGAPDRVFFALTPMQAAGLRAAVAVAYQIDPTGAVLRAEGPLPADAMGAAAVRLGEVVRIDPGPERLRFAFVDLSPTGAETILDAWTETARMPAAIRIDRTDAASGAALGALRVPLLIDGEPGCAGTGKAACSRAAQGEGGQAGETGRAADVAPPSRGATDASGERR